MRQTKRMTAILGAAALCWGIMFPEYTFTADSYTAFVQEAEDAENAESTGNAAGIGNTAGTGNVTVTENAEDTEDLRQAIRDGKVRYRFWIYEYLKNHFFSGSFASGRGTTEFERGIIDLWDIRNKTGMRRSECLTPASAG